MKKLLMFTVCFATVLCLFCGCSDSHNKTERKKAITVEEFKKISTDLGYTEIKENNYENGGVDITASIPNSIAWLTFSAFPKENEDAAEKIFDINKSEIDAKVKMSSNCTSTTGENYETYQGRAKTESGDYGYYYTSRVDNTVLFFYSVYEMDGQGQDVIDAFGY